ncbi:MAG: CPBP family intramembrane metalloprotease [Verrucomicrobiales bacterium]|nr:CPBP family intramembrane metalloprotease [Verrucomicrobiales bacterium]
MQKPTFRQSGAFKILVFLSGIVILSALLAPPLYFAGKHIVAQGWLEGGFLEGLNGSLDRAKFSRYFNRAVLLAALLLLRPTLKWMNAGKEKKTGLREFLNLDPNPAWWKHCLFGFLAAGGTLLLLGTFYVHQGWYETRDPGKTLFSILLQALGTGFAVGFLEEFVFRGALQAVLAKVLKPIPLFFTIAVFFAVIHFFNAPRDLEIGAVTYGTGFWMVGRIFEYFFSQFADPYFLLAEFAVLFAIGIVLGYTRMKTGSLWLGIGLHAGWVFGVKTLSPITTIAFKRAEMMPWLGDSLRVGLISTLIVSLTGLAVWAALRRSPRDPFAPDSK